MNKRDRVKKPFYKRWWFIVIATIFIIGMIGNALESDEDKQKREDERVAAEQQKKDDKKDKEDKKKAAEAEKAAEDEKQKEEELKKEKDVEVEEEKKVNEEERKPNKTIDVAIKEDNKNIDNAILKDGILTLERDPGTVWSENSLFHTVYDLFEALPIAFKDEAVDEVQVLIKTPMVDAKGNEETETVIEYIYARDSFEELNYEKFANMAYGQQWRILNESDVYIIHPGIYKNLKEKIKENLVNGPSKFPLVE